MNTIRELLGIEQNIIRAKETDGRIQNLAAYITPEVLKSIHKEMKKNKAAGIDRVTKADYEVNLDANLDQLVRRMKSGSYKPQPSRRVYIPKDTKGKMRPLGISCYEDKLVEAAIAQILSMVYEPKFYDFSYGFRPGRGCHDAVKAIIEKTQCYRISCVVDADIRSFFDTVNHDWLIKMLEHDIADRKFIELIKRFLKAGIMDNGLFKISDEGTPQGNGASPILANVYLHYVLDNWFDVIVNRQCVGETFLIRYADDWVCCFEYKDEAKVFLDRVSKRLNKYGLKLADNKTRIVDFGCMADGSDTFDFVGFTFYGSTDRKRTFYRSKVRTCKKKFRLKLKAMNEWLKVYRNLPLAVLFEKINQKLEGHYNYYGVTDNIFELKNFRFRTVKLIFYWLNRRSSRKSYSWDAYINGVLKTFPLAKPRTKVNILPTKRSLGCSPI